MTKLEIPKVFHAALDDTIVMLKEIHERRDGMSSIFEHAVLNLLREFHEEYGAVFTLYCFYEVGDEPDQMEFNLSKMTDQFREEWIANSHWLKLSFHARTRTPPQVDYYLYFDRDYETAKADFEDIKREIVRFAGDQAWDNFPRTHFWSGNAETVRAWRDCGVSGMFYSYPGYPALHFTRAQLGRLWRQDYHYDEAYGMYFITTNVKLPCLSVQDVRDRLDSLTDPRILEIFADDYNIIELRDHMEVALQFAVQHGYQPAFYEDVFTPAAVQ